MKIIKSVKIFDITLDFKIFYDNSNYILENRKDGF